MAQVRRWVWALPLLVWRPCLFQQFDQLPLLFKRQMSDLSLVHPQNIGSECLQNRLARWCQTSQHDAAILNLPDAFDQSPLFKPIEHPGHIRTARNQAASQLHGLHPTRRSSLE
jgi:hypothetical protein